MAKTDTITIETSFHNLSNAMLADEIGGLDRQVKELTKRLDEAKAELKARGIEEAVGDKYRAKITCTTRESLDTSALKKAFSEEVLAQFKRFADVFSVRVGVA